MHGAQRRQVSLVNAEGTHRTCQCGLRARPSLSTGQRARQESDPGRLPRGQVLQQRRVWMHAYKARDRRMGGSEQLFASPRGASLQKLEHLCGLAHAADARRGGAPSVREHGDALGLAFASGRASGGHSETTSIVLSFDKASPLCGLRRTLETGQALRKSGAPPPGRVPFSERRRDVERPIRRALAPTRFSLRFAQVAKRGDRLSHPRPTAGRRHPSFACLRPNFALSRRW